LKFKCVVAGVLEKFLPDYLSPLIDTVPRKRFHVGESGGWSNENIGGSVAARGFIA
jgi:hypothetical protein